MRIQKNHSLFAVLPITRILRQPRSTAGVSNTEAVTGPVKRAVSHVRPPLAMWRSQLPLKELFHADASAKLAARLPHRYGWTDKGKKGVAW